MDIAADAGLLRGASALISGGHDEYWSPPERANVTAARDAGVNVAFLGANCMFRRTRLASTPAGVDRLVICYKTSYMQDPDVRQRQRAGHQRLAGAARIPTPSRRSPGRCTSPTRPTPPRWWSARTPGCSAAPACGTAPGSPAWSASSTTGSTPTTRCSGRSRSCPHSPLTCRGINSYADSAYYTHPSGAGVFDAGTMRWVRSLSGRHRLGIDQRTGRFTRQVTANVLRAFADGPAAGSTRPATTWRNARVGGRPYRHPAQPLVTSPAGRITTSSAPALGWS